MSRSIKRKQRCVVCNKEYEGYSWRTTCGSEECMRMNKNGIRPYAENAGKGYVIKSNSVLEVYKDAELLEELGKRGIGVEAKFFRTDISYDIPVPVSKLNKIKFAIVSDSHFGSKMQQLTYLHKFYDICVQEDITTILHGGDIVDGNGKVYTGQLHEMFLYGTDNQEQYVIDHYPKREGITTYFIGGNHDYSFYKDNGHDVCARIAEKRPDLIHLGYTTAYVNLCGQDVVDDEEARTLKTIKIKLRHPKGAPTKTRSTKLQNEFDNITPEEIPDFLFVGHYHHMVYMSQHKGCECILLPSFQGKTMFLEERGLNPTIGGIVMTIWYDDDLNRFEIRPEFKLWRNEIKEDY